MFQAIEPSEKTKQYWDDLVKKAQEKRRKKNQLEASLWKNSEIGFKKKKRASLRKWKKALIDGRVTVY